MATGLTPGEHGIVVSDHGQIFVPREHDIDMDAFLPKEGVLADDEHATFAAMPDFGLKH